jgi:ribosomal 30S subunit maturation factor RimM
VLIPFGEAFVGDIDAVRGTIVVDLPDGYLDET